MIKIMNKINKLCKKKIKYSSHKENQIVKKQIFKNNKFHKILNFMEHITKVILKFNKKNNYKNKYFINSNKSQEIRVPIIV